MTIPFNMNYSFNHLLREVPLDEADFLKGIRFLETEIPHLQGLEKARTLSKLGGYQRIMGLIEQSLQSLMAAENMLTNHPNVRLSIINQLRISQTKQFKREFEHAKALLEDIETNIKSTTEMTDLLDFIHQHQGKNYFDQQNYSVAKVCFEKALVIREQKGDENLIQSTIHALEVTKNRMSQ